LPSVIVHLWKIRKIESLIESYNKIVMVNLESFLLKPEFEMLVAKEIRILVDCFLVQLGIADKISYDFSSIVSAIVEYDDAYRYRIQDLFSETSKKCILENPRKELKKLMRLAYERDHYDVENNARNNILLVLKVISYMLYIPKVKRAFKYAVGNSDFSRLQYDKADNFWANMRADYDTEGKSYLYHQEKWKEQGIVLPQAFRVTMRQ